jgi:hypothetical protein
MTNKADERCVLLDRIGELIAKAKSLELPDSAFLLNVAHLDLKTKIHNIDEDEMQAFVSAVQVSADGP